MVPVRGKVSISSNLRRQGEVTQGHLKIGAESKRKTKTHVAFGDRTVRILEPFGLGGGEISLSCRVTTLFYNFVSISSIK